MKLLCSLVACIITLDYCLAFHQSRQSHGHFKHKKSHGLHRESIKMPSGTLESITTPYKSSHFKCGDHAQRIYLDPHGKMGKYEYNVVKREVMAGATTDANFQITKIEKIINPCLWSKYWFRKQQIGFEANETNEMMLFHYSPAANSHVIDSGFDERHAEMGVYGAGLYFSTNSKKAHDNLKPKPDGTRTLLLCRVALGKFMETAATVRAHAPVGYHSVKGQGSEDYVVYRGEQAYPEYLITYRI